LACRMGPHRTDGLHAKLITCHSRSVIRRCASTWWRVETPVAAATRDGTFERSEHCFVCKPPPELVSWVETMLHGRRLGRTYRYSRISYASSGLYKALPLRSFAARHTRSDSLERHTFRLNLQPASATAEELASGGAAVWCAPRESGWDERHGGVNDECLLGAATTGSISVRPACSRADSALHASRSTER
jgi:hypothetical protein